MARLKAHFGAALVSFGPHASTVPAESMGRVPQVDAMIVGEPEDAIVALAAGAAFTPELLGVGAGGDVAARHEPPPRSSRTQPRARSRAS